MIFTADFVIAQKKVLCNISYESIVFNSVYLGKLIYETPWIAR